MPKPKTLGRPPRPPAAGFNGKIGKRLRAARKSQGLTVDDLAAKTGLARSMIYDYEAGKFSPSIESLDKLSRAIKVRLGVILEGLL